MSNELPEKGTSRFAYHGSDPMIGGVREVTDDTPSRRPATAGSGAAAARNAPPIQQRGPAAGPARPEVSGVPGPEVRLLDISEMTRTVGMHYVHNFRIPPTPGAEEGLDLAGPMEGQVTLTNTGAALLLSGEVRAPVTLECGRCLNPTVQPVEAELDEQFDLVTTATAYNQEIVTAVDEDPQASVIDNGNILNLGELLRQNLLLAAPPKPLCREDCPGIDIAGHAGVEYTVESDQAAAEPEPIEESVPDNPLRRLADLMEAKRRSEENGTGNAA